MVVSRVSSLCALVLLCALIPGCNSSETERSPSLDSPIGEAETRSLYIRKCSLCHGDDGDLGASKSPMLSESMMSLEERIAIISYGKGTMPAQKGILSKSEITAVARYIDRFRN